MVFRAVGEYCWTSQPTEYYYNNVLLKRTRMSTQRNPASDLLLLLAATFPRTFFADAKQVQPLKLNIHQDLYAALPAGLPSRQVQAVSMVVRQPSGVSKSPSAWERSH